MHNSNYYRKLLSTYKQNGQYIAGLPSYPRNFSRDTILAGLICQDIDLLKNQIAYSAKHQGSTYDTLTGEEPGKIHHEFPGVSVREPYMTTYNACDTTALFVIAIYELLQLKVSETTDVLHTYDTNIDRAITYLLRHVRDSIFWEYPPLDAKQYSLQVTYWKDSILPNKKTESSYPVAYALSHFQAAYGLSCAGKLRKDEELQLLADRMYKSGIETFIRNDNFILLIDSDGPIKQLSSDELHCLRYIPELYKDTLPIQAIEHRAASLYTAAGIACTPKEISKTLDDTYHGYVVWPFEQALIHAGAVKFGLDQSASVASRCFRFIDNGHELLSTDPEIEPLGNDRQLWSVAAALYFSMCNLQESHQNVLATTVS